MTYHPRLNITCADYLQKILRYGVIDLPRNTSTIQSDLNDLRNWSEYWQLPFNESKCKAIHFGFHNPKIEYKLNDHTLEVVHEEKDLGIFIDDTLDFINILHV